MASLFDDFQKFGKEHLEAATSVIFPCQELAGDEGFGYGMANW